MNGETNRQLYKHGYDPNELSDEEQRDLLRDIDDDESNSGLPGSVPPEDRDDA
jgi:hypothetical protein